MNLNIGKARVIAFTRKRNVVYYNYKICDPSVTLTDTIQDLGVQLNSKLHFHVHVDYIFSQSVRMLGLIRIVTYSFSTFDNLPILYLTLVPPKPEYASTVWSSITDTDAKKLERIQRKFVALYQNRFSTHDHVTYEVFLEFLKLHTLHDRRLHLDALFFISVYLGLKCCPCLLYTIGIRVPCSNVRNSSLFTDTCKNCPSARCVAAANRVCKDIDIFRKPVTYLKQILRWNWTFLTLTCLYFFRV
jgi:hypothetical protein